MTICMEKAALQGGEKCSICWDGEKKEYTFLGHKDPSKNDGKIYCFVHDNCLKHQFFQNASFKCPTCLRSIKIESVVSRDDLEESIFKVTRKESITICLTAAACGAGGSAISTLIYDGGIKSLLKVVSACIGAGLFFETIGHCYKKYFYNAFFLKNADDQTSKPCLENRAVVTQDVMNQLRGFKRTKFGLSTTERIVNYTVCIFFAFLGAGLDVVVWRDLGIKYPSSAKFISITSGLSGALFGTTGYLCRLSIEKEEFYDLFKNK